MWRVIFILLVCSSLFSTGYAEENAALELPVQLPSQGEADVQLATLFPEEFSEPGKSGANSDNNGLLNENRQWGALYSPRFQMDAGTALRMGLAQNNLRISKKGFRAILAAIAAVAMDGSVISRLPERQFPGFRPSPEDQASGAAFFLADACSALLAARDRRTEFSNADDWKTVVDALGRAVIWLETQQALLVEADRQAPNRLLLDALAFRSCNELIDRQSGFAAQFVGLALLKSRTDGVFEEGGGSDTTYQAVSVRLALAILLAGYDEADAAALWKAQIRGARWLANRVRSDGSVDSSDNTRSCGGGESFLGKKKWLSVKTVFQALAYTGVIANEQAFTKAASRVASWAKANPRGNPCL